MEYVIIAIIFTILGFIVCGILASGKMADLEFDNINLNEKVCEQKERLDFYEKQNNKNIDISSNSNEKINEIDGGNEWVK